MAIRFQVLGQPGRDNALYVEVDSGQSITRLQFDCGEACLRELGISEIRAIDHLFFSHFHIDHVAGFDCFLRSNYNRSDKPVHIWGPVGAADVIHHRLRGATWNLLAGEPGEFLVTEIHPDRLRTFRFLTREEFATANYLNEQPRGQSIVEDATYRVDCSIMDHGTPSIAYCVREEPKLNVNLQSLAGLGLEPGPWLKKVKCVEAEDHEQVSVEGRTYQLGELRRRLLESRPGESVAYLTDFRLGPESEDRLIELIRGCTTVVCECNFRNTDQLLAAESYHLVSADVARLASRAEVQKLVIFHLSDRYASAGWREQLAEVRAGFPAADFPETWRSI